MSKKIKIKVVFGILLLLIFITIAGIYLSRQNILVLNPAGPIAEKERNLMFFALGLSLIVIIPVFAMGIMIAWKYRETNTTASYRPEWDHNRLYETVWWGIPTILILILSIVAWNSSHTLDPFRPIASTQKPLSIQVVALDWKWLFIYPEQHIATVNFVQFPVSVPVNFTITSDAPMNSLWIPQLAGQIYAMPGMSTQLHLMASKSGDYYGSSANISGEGFAGMHFIAQASSPTQFNQWVQSVSQSPKELTASSYNSLAQPSQNNPVTYYALGSQNLYNSVVLKYMTPANSSYSEQNASESQMAGMEM